MKYAFFGSPSFAAIILEKLIQSGLPPAIVICNPDKPTGRKKIITPPKTKTIAQKYNIPVHQPEKSHTLTTSLFPDIQFAVLAAYSQILNKETINLFPKGIIVVHPSLLPKYRGATPIQSAILTGESETGTTLFLIDEGIDHGPILAHEKIKLDPQETYQTLEKKLAELSADLLTKTLPQFSAGKIQPQTQIESESTYTKKFKTEDAFVDLEKDEPIIIERKTRALNPEPGTWTMQNGKRIKILEVNLINNKIQLKKIQIEGEKPKILK